MLVIHTFERNISCCNFPQDNAKTKKIKYSQLPFFMWMRYACVIFELDCRTCRSHMPCRKDGWYPEAAVESCNGKHCSFWIYSSEEKCWFLPTQSLPTCETYKWTLRWNPNKNIPWVLVSVQHISIFFCHYLLEKNGCLTEICTYKIKQAIFSTHTHTHTHTHTAIQTSL